MPCGARVWMLCILDAGLRGQPDRQIFELAVSRDLTLISADIGFGNILQFPLGSHRGIVIVRFPNEIPTTDLNLAIVRALRGLTSDEIEGAVVIVEPGRIRLRRQE